MTYESTKPFSCPHCPLRTTTQERKDEHIKRVHPYLAMADGLISEQELMLIVQHERDNPRKKKSKSKKRDKSPGYDDSEPVAGEAIYQDDLVLGSQEYSESKPASDFLVQAMDQADRHENRGQSSRSPIHSPPLNMHVGQAQGSSQTIRQAHQQSAATIVTHPQIIQASGGAHIQTAAAHIVSHHPQAAEVQGPPYIASVMIDGVPVQLTPEVQAQIQGQWSYM